MKTCGPIARRGHERLDFRHTDKTAVVLNTTSKSAITPPFLIGTLLCGLFLCRAGPIEADPIYDFDLPEPPQARENQSLSLEQALERFSPAVQPGLRKRFDRAGVPYPPQALTMIGLKEEGRLELWAYHDDRPRYIDSYPIHDASGLPGPKRRRGDHQVPEGIYRIDAFNPNSSFHLSLRLNYPNRFDRQMGKRDERNDLGNNIFIHGSDYSEGCLAMGDPAIEELFVLVADVGMDNTRVIIAPRDPRTNTIFPVPRGLPEWTEDLYAKLERTIADYSSSRKNRSPTVDARPRAPSPDSDLPAHIRETSSPSPKP